jgi:NAD(P)-dependent dehydrogenase (short-subunit alcohol dehydrogenase family)
MTTTLITGANKGLGLEAARQLVAAGHTVYVGSRDAELGRQVADELGARAIQLDITDDASVQATAKSIEADGGLDVLVNNAAIEERGDDNAVIGPADVTADLMRKTFDTNVFGTVRMLHAFLPLLQRSAAPVVVNVSSGLGVQQDRSERQHRYSDRRAGRGHHRAHGPGRPRRIHRGVLQHRWRRALVS